MKKICVAIFFTLLFFIPKIIYAQKSSNFITDSNQEEITINLFWSESCPHCHLAKAFIENLSSQNDQIIFHEFEIGNKNNAVIMQKVGQKLRVSTNGVPLIVIGDQTITGYLNDETQGKEIKDAVEACQTSNDCQDIVTQIFKEDLSNYQKKESESPSKPLNKSQKKITLPFLDEINPDNFSLPLLTIIIALLDGFNPCAMWVLVFLIGLLLRLEDIKRRWILGFTFIFASGFVYFLFLSAWLNFFLFVGFVSWVRIIIGLVAVYAGYYNLKDFFTNPDSACKVTHSNDKQVIFSKLKNIVKKQNIWIALVGIILLAFAVNMVELVCSAGLPAIFTQIISLKNLPTWQYYAYLLLYILMFMLDDLLIFILAMKTLQITGLSNKYSRVSRLVGGIVILILGIILILKPGLITGA